MNIDAIPGLGMDDEVAPALVRPLAAAAHHATAAPGLSFADRIASGLAELNGQLLATQADLQRLAVGETENLHEIMVRLEESRISLQLMLQVRSRVLEAYQDIMRMQV